MNEIDHRILTRLADGPATPSDINAILPTDTAWQLLQNLARLDWVHYDGDNQWRITTTGQTHLDQQESA